LFLVFSKREREREDTVMARVPLAKVQLLGDSGTPYSDDNVLTGLFRTAVIIHAIAGVAHLSFGVVVIVIAWGKDFGVKLVRPTSRWTSMGVYESGFTDAGVDLHFEVLTAMFFFLSFSAHAIWVGSYLFGEMYLFRLLRDRCIAPLRWLEYTLSATVMVVLIATLVGIRDAYMLLAIAALNASTMLAGFLTELQAAPLNDDKWRDERVWVRLAPHIVGYVPYVVEWVLVVVQFLNSIYDLPSELQDRIPAFVVPAVYGSVAIFTSFAVVQVLFQCRRPAVYYWSEVWYAVLSLTAKVYLGSLLMLNIFVRASIDEALGA
jgi:hypothetical protein